MQKVIERILNLLAFLLTVGRPVTADEIRHTVKGYDQPSDEAFRRTFERDKDLLRTLGVPVTLRPTDIWEVELGYVVPTDEYAISDPGFTDEELSALLLAAQAVRFGGQVTEAAAIFKLGGAAGSSGSAALADLGHDLKLLGDLFEAVSGRHRVLFTYRHRPRTVEPYALAHRFGHWYLLAPEAGARETVKAFRLDRMSEIKVDEAADTFERPGGFDPSSALPNLFGGDQPERVTATVRFDAEVSDVALAQATGAVVISRNDDTVTARIAVSSESRFIGWILGFDARAVIESPPELVTAFLTYLGGDA
ncbi:MAG: WYL domain-containing protein [Actinomycetota bacterium]|nr:WYL domain-containing protein [Actinomycetota bacterium]